MRQSNQNSWSRLAVSGLCLIAVIVVSGCVQSGGQWFSRSANAVLLTSFSSDDAPLASRTINHSFEIEQGETWHLLNIAGTLELKMGKGELVEVEAIIYAEGDNDQHTEKLLKGMTWTTITGESGNVYQILSYPIDDYKSFHYPGVESGRSMMTIDGQILTVTDKRSPESPTLYADLTITYPESARLDVSNCVGNIVGGKLSGHLSLDTGSGIIKIRAFEGTLDTDTGSGDIILGDVVGDLTADTGSGNITIDSIKGDSNLGTGSGNIEVQKVRASELDADTGSGDITLHDGEIDRVSLDSGSGIITLDEIEFESLDAETGSGNINVTSSLKNTTQISADSGSGSLIILARPGYRDPCNQPARSCS